MRSRAARRSAAVLIAVSILLSDYTAHGGAPEDSVDFERDVAPVLARRCVSCHGPVELKGELDLTRAATSLAGGESGLAFLPGKPDESLLIQRVERAEMPPRKKGAKQPLPPREVALLRAWIASGALWPEGRVLDPSEATTEDRAGRDWWSLQPPKRPPVPDLRSRERAASPIDAFVLARLEAESMEMAPPADRRTLARRLSFDLHGLPPAREDLDTCAAEPPDTLDRHIDRLLASPHYGERRARRWLDLVRFAETNGYERDAAKPHAWKYRDYVVGAFNADKPYDRFVAEQLAGDELEDRSEGTVTATGFLRLGTWDDEPNDPLDYKYERIEDLVHATSTAFLGLTVKCARCHDHKFDPVPQSDYYRLASAFWAGSIEPRDAKLQGGPSREELGSDLLGWTDIRTAPPPLHLLRKGDPRAPGDEVPAAAPSFVPALDRPFDPPPAGAKTTRRRFQLARWITDPRHPLASRVAANRVWQQLLGEGLVRSPENFGFKGDRPTHPELLDWLAVDLIAGDWSLKRLERQVLSSSTYRMASLHPQGDTYERRDAADRFLWRAYRRRLDAEALRDAMLSASGEIDLRLGGPSFFPEIQREALEGLSRKGADWKPSPEPDRHRRSLYIFTQRSLLVPLMTAFDFCDTTQPCARRDVTTVAPQALALLNNSFAHGRSASLAKRVEREAGLDRGARVEHAWRLAFGRTPSPAEAEAALDHLEAQARHFVEAVEEVGEARDSTLGVTAALALWLRADRGVVVDGDGRVEAWKDGSGRGHDAVQGRAEARPRRGEARPLRTPAGPAASAALVFDGKQSYFEIIGQVLVSPRFSGFAVVSDFGGEGHREVFSNWNGGAGNSTTSVFLGLSGSGTVRFSDDLSAPLDRGSTAGRFVLTAVAGAAGAAVWRDGSLVKDKGAPLAPRNLGAPYVVGQQGNIQGEFWHGEIAELVVYDRELAEGERRSVEQYLFGRHGLEAPRPAGPDPEHAALASLCHVLLNANEFIYVD